MEYSYEQIKLLAKQTGSKVTDLIALAPQNDPFYTGTPNDRALAEWFAELWFRFGYMENVHIRRVHYQIVSQDPLILLPNGTPYLNSIECWDTLMMAAKHARYLQLVDPSAFVDRKNPVAIEYAPEYDYEPEMNVNTYNVESELPDFPSPPSFDLYGYQGNQRYHVELFCFPPETLVQTITGPKPISTIQMGDMVLTHRGRYQPVINTFQRPYSGNLVRVRARYSARDVRMTPNHQVLALQGKSSHGGRTAKELAWIPAGDLVTLNEGKHYKGDYVAFPRIAEQSMPLPLLEPDMSKGGRSDGRGGLLPIEMQNVLVDADVAWMLGVFVGDGCVDTRSLHFTLHAREQDLANRLVQIGGRFGLQPKTHTCGNGNTLKVSYHSTRLVNWFRREFGGESNGRSHTGSRNKRFPSWIISAPQEITEAFLYGYWQADGMNHSAGPGHFSVVTSSINVAEGMRLILARLGHCPSITITRDGHYIMHWGGKHHWGKQREDYLLFPIREILTEQYEGDVYNIEVAEDNSYVTEFVVHNCEKSTMNDILVPLCQRYGLNLQTGAGELSITAALNLVRRIEKIGKPARILYISDFDPAGQSMPLAIARKLEYFIRHIDLNVDVRLFPLVLTPRQVVEYSLPRTPIKESERRRVGFEERHGSGATELDALEALRPGELERILLHAIGRYYDRGLETRVDDARQDLERELAKVRQEVLDEYDDEIASLRNRYEAIRTEFAQRVSAYNEDFSALWNEIGADLHTRMPDLDEFSIPEPEEADELGDGLYNSQRSYMDQLEAYKAFQGK